MNNAAARIKIEEMPDTILGDSRIGAVYYKQMNVLSFTKLANEDDRKRIEAVIKKGLEEGTLHFMTIDDEEVVVCLKVPVNERVKYPNSQVI